MKKIIIMFVIGLLGSQMMQAQGTVYLSNLGTQGGLTGPFSVGSDSSYAAGFSTGTNAGGYMLNSIQLQMNDATGTPSGFEVSIYNTATSTLRPGNSIAILDGSANPSTAGIYTYTPDSSLILSPNYIYWIVVTSATPVANGAYMWGNAGSGFTENGGWKSFINVRNAQYALTATPVPEPSTWMLLMSGAALLLLTKSGLRCRRPL